jgi:hypothetical protein
MMATESSAEAAMVPRTIFVAVLMCGGITGPALKLEK